jgi:Cohesin domain
MRTYLRIILVLAVCLAYAAGAAASPARAAGAVSLTADKTSVQAGEQFTVSVSIDDTPGLFGAQFSLAYDNTLVKVVDVQPGSVWPADRSFVAVNRFSDGGTAAEHVEFAATLIDSSLTVPAGVLQTIVFEALSPAEASTAVFSDGPTLPLLLATIDGMPIEVAPPADLAVTVNPPPPAEILGQVALQVSGADRPVTVEVAGPTVDYSSQLASGSQFSFTVPTAAAGYTLTVSAPCHATARVTGVSAPAGDLNLTLAAGDVNGDGAINIQDVAAVAFLYGSTGVSGCANVNGDAEDGGTIDLLDLSLVAGNYGQ